MSTPRGFDPKAWGVAVGDVSRLIADGRAAEALSLGWSIMDLFGVEPPRSDDDYRNGLAVWLAGRPLVLLDADSAIVRVGERHSIFNRRRDRSGCVLVWELGK
ncbi:MAG: hypothetical protein EOP21_07535 [Hyphomicrobiales bacterium]|nr:MAG: hypothetical protein EOP21_07535 [Hyphomicrobiales bacterium]